MRLFENKTGIPHLKKTGNCSQLYVNNRPLLMRAGEVGNSAASSISYMSTIWQSLKDMNLNTVLIPVYWELIEPDENRFDFSLIDSIINQVRKNKMHLVFLWFGSWKNSMSCYVPSWVKRDYVRFPRTKSKAGIPQEILTPFCKNNLDADLKAYSMLMKHIHRVDENHHTIVMIQVENEAGMLPDARDFSDWANESFKGPVPQDLVSYLVRNKNLLTEEILKQWEGSGFRTTGSWEEIFGKGTAADEIFTAWHYARFIDTIAFAGKREYPIPVYVNAALNKPDLLPGEYPAGGPLPHIMDIWKAGAPNIDIFSPDFYNPNLIKWSDLYNRGGNIYFIPEIYYGSHCPAFAFYAIGHHNAIGISPFAIESVKNPKNERLSKAYDILGQLDPLIGILKGKNMIDGVLLDRENPSQNVVLGNYTFEFSFEPDDPYAIKCNINADPGFKTGAIIIMTGQDEYIIAGSGVILIFSPSTNAGGVRSGIISDEEGIFKNGKWITVLRCNGDQTHQGRHVRLKNDEFSIHKVKLYNYSV